MFPNLLHWRRHQVPGSSRGFGGRPKGHGAGKVGDDGRAI